MLPSKTLLMPGPWTVSGNTVKDGYGKTVAVCFGRNPVAHAYWIAEIPKLIADVGPSESIDSALTERDELRTRIADLEAQLSTAEEQISDMKIDLETANDDLAEAQEQIAALKAKTKAPEHI